MMAQRSMPLPLHLPPACTLLLVGLLAACGGGDDPERPSFDSGRCAFRLHPSQVPGQTVRCGDLVVPEERGDPHAPRIRVPVLVFLAATEQDVPVINLSGGPGQSWQDLGLDTWPAAETRRLVRDVVFIEQRGTGLSQPALTCPELSARSMSAMGDGTAELAACHRRLTQQGIGLASYHTAALAADVADLARALGYEQVLLAGISYGTLWAQTVLRDFPGLAWQAILDSVVPVHLPAVVRSAGARETAFSGLFAACQQDAACGAAFPALEQEMTEALAGLRQQPLAYGMMPAGKITDEDLFWTAESLLLFNPGLVPLFIHTLREAVRAGHLEQVDPRIGQALRSTAMATASLAIGQYLSVRCGDDDGAQPAEMEADLARVRPAFRPYLQRQVEGQQRLCRLWPHRAARPDARTPLRSGTPALLLAGGLDPRTPVPLAREAVKGLTRGTLVEYPGLAHAIQGQDPSGCTRDIVRQFLTGRPVDKSCAAQVRTPFIR
jgi:pimeloyl-ACP methyl ester carboxylesterase